MAADHELAEAAAAAPMHNHLYSYYSVVAKRMSLA